MSVEENKAVNHHFFEKVFNQRNPAAMEQFFALDMVCHSLPQGTQAHRQFLRKYFNAFPDLTATIEDMIAEGDKVVTCVSYRGIHQGAFMDIPPTSKQNMITGIDTSVWLAGSLLSTGNPLTIWVCSRACGCPINGVGWIRKMQTRIVYIVGGMDTRLLS